MSALGERIGVTSPVEGLLFAGCTNECDGLYQEIEAAAALEAADAVLAREARAVRD